MKKIIVSIILICILVGLIGCSSAQNTQSGSSTGSSSVSSNSGETANTIMFTDSAGREVEIPTDITKISPAGRLAQLFLISLAPEKLASLSDQPFTEISGIVDERLLELPLLGRIYGDEGINYEELATVDPQLIIDIGETKDSIAEDLDNLTTATTIPAVHIVSDTENAGEVFRMLGELLGLEEQAEKLAVYCEQTNEQIDEIMEQVGDEKANIIYSLGSEGQNVLANGSIHADIIDTLSNNLAVVDLPVTQGTGNEVNMEQLISWNPDVIIFEQNSAYEAAGEDSLWGQITAIQNGDYYKIPSTPYNWLGNPPSVNRYIGLWWMVKTLYPEQATFDLREKVDEYYELFYDCDLSDEQYNELMKNSLPK